MLQSAARGGVPRCAAPPTMTAKPAIALAAVAASSLLALGLARAQGAAPGEDLSRIWPGLALDQLTPAQRETLAKVAEDEFCYCGCPHTLAGCLREHGACRHAKRMNALAARLAAAGLTRLEILKVLTEYYASFDRQKRATLDVKAFGPPLGNPEAPVTIVEFSDFTCPYCRQLRARLEAFVEARRDRVRLFFKPFPIASHPRAMEAAEAAEWARDRGLFWKMHDAIFEGPQAPDDDSLAAAAQRLGGNPQDLRAALETRRNRARIQASQAEARAAGLPGTPTLYLNGRRFTLPEYSDAALEFALQDEEEWVKNKGWAKD